MEMTNRPLSPHLQIYRPQLTSVLSIAHRGSGVFLVLGSLMLVYWVLSAAAGPEAYAGAQEFSASLIGRTLLFAWTFALFYHLCNGIRHLFWDAGKGYELETAYASGKAVLVFSVILALATFGAGYAMRGGV